MAHNGQKKLKPGFTTGTAAAAGVKGALYLLLKNNCPSQVNISLLPNGQISIPIFHYEKIDINKAICTIIKDAGDDPDITHKAEIGAKVCLIENSDDIIITGGKGVGKVTKPGLEIAPGEPAINPGPQKMIRKAVTEVLKECRQNSGVKIEIFVPQGKQLAQKTLNARLGIIGGISILGTTGIVKPMSHDAYIASIRSAMSVARASGVKQIVLTTGRRSERYAQNLLPNLPEEAFIQIGDFFQLSLQAASKLEFSQIFLTVFFGKAVKMAQGAAHTHAAKSSLTMHKLSKWAFDITGDQNFANKILNANTARHAFEFISKSHPELINHVGMQMVDSAKKFAISDIDICGIILDFNGNLIFNSKKLF